MKKITGLTAIILVSFGLSSSLLGQSCEKFYKKGDCAMDLQKDYKIYSQSNSAPISLQDTIEFNVVFYGQKDYIFTFCADKKLYPVNYRLIDPDTGEILYNNADDRYIESLGIGFDITRGLTIQINVLGKMSDPKELQGYTGCVGALFQYKNYEH
ncbi:MAG: hypothetical protein ISS19_03765 [Bacteroidales bacterium]|nr:hypothetical protein [Bacteroidales bacterium]